MNAQDVALGFTATRAMTEAHRPVVEQAIRDCIERHFPYELPVCVTGGCVGGDALLARWLTNWGLRVHVVLPFNRSQVDSRWEEYCDSFEAMPEGTDYRRRNEKIVWHSDRVLAFAEWPEDDGRSRRSGTWMTVRIARRMGVPVDVVVLNGGTR